MSRGVNTDMLWSALGGRPPLDRVVMFKGMILQQWYYPHQLYHQVLLNNQSFVNHTHFHGRGRIRPCNDYFGCY